VLSVNPALLTIDNVATSTSFTTSRRVDRVRRSVPVRVLLGGRFRHLEDSRGRARLPTRHQPSTPPRRRRSSTARTSSAGPSPLRLTLDLSSGTGSFNGDIAFNRGTQSGSIPPAQLNGWTFAGLTSGGGTGTPEGYQHQVDGEIRVPDVVPATPTTWGQVKSTYRR
jgi:hypothetical protein